MRSGESDGNVLVGLGYAVLFSAPVWILIGLLVQHLLR